MNDEEIKDELPTAEQLELIQALLDMKIETDEDLTSLSQIFSEDE